MALPRSKTIAGGPKPNLKVRAKAAKMPPTTSKAKSLRQTATTFEPSGIFRFEDLPGEIRNQIYGHALVARGPIQISRHVDRATMETERSTRFSLSKPKLKSILLHKLSAIVKRNDGKRARKLNFRDIHSLALLLTNKNIRNKARPLLYAHNTFRFECPKAFYDFYGFASDAFSFLEDLEFVDPPVSSKIKAPLANCVKLSRVSITIKSNWIGRSPAAPNRISFIFAALHNLVLQCWCDKCRPAKVKPSDPQRSDRCIAKSHDDQKHRLEMVSLQLHTCSFQLMVVETHQKIHVNANEDDSREMANDLNAGISGFAKQAFTRNARIAELKQTK